MSVSEWFSDPDYTGAFQAQVDKWDERGDWGGNTLRYAIFSTLNDGPSHPSYRGRLQLARERYGLHGGPDDIQTTGHSSPTAVFLNYQDSVVQPTVGRYMAVTSWLAWFKIGFSGLG